MKGFWVWLAVLVIASSAGMALSCQYTHNVTLSNTSTRLFYGDTGVDAGDPLSIEVLTANSTGGSGQPMQIKVTNPLNYTINIDVKFLLCETPTPNSSCIDVKKDLSAQSINPQDYTVLQQLCSDSGAGFCKIDPDSITYQVTQPHVLLPRTITIPYDEIVCNECLGAECLNDGFACQRTEQCGGKHCVHNICSPNASCYNNKCLCKSDQVQCGIECVSKDKPVGANRTCSDEECETKYSENGTCSLTPVQKLDVQRNATITAATEREHVQNWWIGFIAILVLLCAGIYYIIHRVRFERTMADARKKEAEVKRLETEIKAEQVRFQNFKAMKEEEIRVEKEKLKILEAVDKATIEQERRLAAHHESIKIKRQEIADEKKKMDDMAAEITKPFPSRHANGRLVVINPYLGGYLCFYEEGLPLEEYSMGKLLHRWVWKKHNGRWPLQGYHIHHKDENKLNNDISNLEEIQGDEHYARHQSF